MARVEESYPAHSKSIDATGKIKSAEIHYLVFEVATENEALQAVLDHVPQVLNDLNLDEISIDERLDENIFSVNATYASSETSSDDTADDAEATMSFSAGGGTIHLIEAISQRKIFGKKNANNLIGWNGKGGDDCNIEGVDVPAPQFKETYTKKMPVSKLTTAYRRSIGGMIGTVNKYKFKGWEPGEVMFDNISFSAPTKGGEPEVEVTFEFSIQLNEKNYSFAGHTVNKKGFEYVWAIPTTVRDEGNPSVTPSAAFIAQVVRYSDFSKLGI